MGSRLDDSAPSGIIMRDPVESSGLWRFVGIRRAEVRGQFPCSRGDSGVPRMRGCAFPGSGAGQSLRLDDSVPSGIKLCSTWRLACGIASNRLGFWLVVSRLAATVLRISPTRRR